MVKKVRSATGIGDTPVSVSYVAVKLAKELLGGIAGKTAMILGVGEMGALTVRNLIRPKTIMDLVDQTMGEILDLLGVQHQLFWRWGEGAARPGSAPSG